MILLIIIPVYISLNLYILHRVHKWLTACSERFHSGKFAVPYIVIYSLLALSLLFAFLLPSSELQVLVKRISNYWLGTFAYILIFIAVADILRLVLKKIPGKIHDFFFSKVGYVFVGILHLGYSVGNRQMQRMVKKINDQNADLVVFAGDIFDNEYEAVQNPDRIAKTLAGIKSRYGSFGVFGNHDVTERLLGGFSVASQAKEMRDPRFEEFAKKAKIRFLDDEVMLIDDAFYLVGRKDAQKPGDGTKNRMEPEVILSGLDKDKPIIVLEHQPKQLKELETAGADMQLCGHTHDGQMFPGNLTVKLMWENACGYLKKGNLHSIVTSGVGVWGPAMRVGTDCEICPITIHFQG